MQMFIFFNLLSFLGACSSSTPGLETTDSIRHLEVNSDDESLKLIQDKKNFYQLLLANKPEGQLIPPFAEEACSRANTIGEIEYVRGGKSPFPQAHP